MSIHKHAPFVRPRLFTLNIERANASARHRRFISPFRSPSLTAAHLLDSSLQIYLQLITLFSIRPYVDITYLHPSYIDIIPMLTLHARTPFFLLRLATSSAAMLLLLLLLLRSYYKHRFLYFPSINIFSSSLSSSKTATKRRKMASSCPRQP